MKCLDCKHSAEKHILCPACEPHKHCSEKGCDCRNIVTLKVVK